MGLSPAKIAKFAAPAWPLVDSRAKQSQDDKPLTHQEPVRTASVNYGLRSHPSLRSRRGMKVSATWPLLTGLSFALPIAARPFGLGCRYDEAPSGNGLLPAEPFRARRFEPTRESLASLAHSPVWRNSDSRSKPVGPRRAGGSVHESGGAGTAIAQSLCIRSLNSSTTERE